MSRSRKIGLAVLLAAAGALVVDKTLLPRPGPEAPTAGASMPPVPPPTARSPAPAAAPGVPAPTAALPQASSPQPDGALTPVENDPGLTWLSSRAERPANRNQAGPQLPAAPGEGRDLFRPSEQFRQWQDRLSVQAKSPTEPNAAKRTVLDHGYTLSGLLITGAPSAGRLATINGEVYAPGQAVGPFTVLYIADEGVLLGLGTEQVWLRMPP